MQYAAQTPHGMTKNAKNPKYPYCTLFSLTGELVELDITVGTGEGAKVGELSTTVSYVEEGEMGEGEKVTKGGEDES